MRGSYLSSSRGYSSESDRLGRSTTIAFLASVILTVTVVLPAEYGLDPTGIGKLLGLQAMGEIKQSLAKEAFLEKTGVGKSASQENFALPSASQAHPPTATTMLPAPQSQRQEHQMTFVLEPDQGAEIKLDMKKGMETSYSWVATGGLVNYDAHGNPYESSKGFNHSYGSGRQVEADKGTLVASFDGLHGWFWRNRSGKKITITLSTSGSYLSIKRAA